MLKFGCYLYLLRANNRFISVYSYSFKSLWHTHTLPHLPHSEHHADISCSAHNDSNKGCLIYSQHDLNSMLQISPSMLLCCPTRFLRSPISQIYITEPKRMTQGSFILLINPQNKTWKYVIILFVLAASIDEELNGFWLCYQTNTAFDHALEKTLCPLDLTVELWKYLLDSPRGEEARWWRGGGKQTEMKVNDQR